MYDPTVGRFLTEDPLGLKPDENLYRYVGNSPTSLTDPTGLDPGLDGSGDDPGTYTQDGGPTPLDGGERQVPSAYHRTFSLTFVESKTDVANHISSAWNRLAHQDSCALNEATPDWDAAMKKLDEIPDNSLTEVRIAGHANRRLVGLFDENQIRKESTAEHKFLKKLAQKLRPGAIVELAGCNAAEDGAENKLLSAFAEVLGAEVHGYTGLYCVMPMGEEWAASPGEAPHFVREISDSPAKRAKRAVQSRIQPE